MGKKIKLMICILTIVILLFMAVGFVDYWSVHSFEKPIFAVATATTGDGGSGMYQGIGYSIYIEGNFMPEDEFPGVTRYEYFLFGMSISNAVRD